jgi:ferredoxin
MYCNAGTFVAIERAAPGAYFAAQLDKCLSCGKCIDLCPCGFLSVA